MNVLINMEMPKEPDEWIEIAIFGDGKVIQTGESWRNLENGKCYYTTTTPEKFFNAAPAPQHGRLIDADALTDCLATLLQFPSNLVNGQWIVNTIREQPTIIPASEEGE